MSTNPSNKTTAAIFYLLSRTKDPSVPANDRAYAWTVINKYLFGASPPAIWTHFPLITRGDVVYTKTDFVSDVLAHEKPSEDEDEDYSGWDEYTFDGKPVSKQEFDEGMARSANFVDWDTQDGAAERRHRYVGALLEKIVYEWREQVRVMGDISRQWMAMRTGEGTAA